MLSKAYINKNPKIIILSVLSDNPLLHQSGVAQVGPHPQQLGHLQTAVLHHYEIV